MKRRDLLRTLGAVGAATAVGDLAERLAAGGQSFPGGSGRSITDDLASRLAASIQKHKVRVRAPHCAATASGKSRPPA